MRFFFLLLFPLALAGTARAGDGGAESPYEITIRVNGIGNDDAILAYYYMDKKYIRDSVRFENGVGVIESDEPIPKGVYLLAFPSWKLKYFELILGDERRFTMSTDTADVVGNMVVEGSLENSLFYENMAFMRELGKQNDALNAQLSATEPGSDQYKAVANQLEALDDQVRRHRMELVDRHPEAFYSKVLLAMTDIELPENPDPADSAYAYRYYQQHYFDNVDFNEPGLTRTPFLLSRTINFLENYTLPEPDSINAAADRIIEKSRVNEEMFQFFLVGIFNHFARSKVMAHELVYVHLAKKYYVSGVADWVTDEQRKKFTDKVTKMEPSLLGNTAPEIIIADIDGVTRRLHESSAGNDYTILVFWNSGCGHCKKTMPLLKESFVNEWQQLGKIGVFAVSTELETDEWKKFIEEHDLRADNWYNAHDPFGRNPFRVMYDIESTPVILVLNKDLKIIGKRLAVEQIADLIGYDSKRRGSEKQ